MAEELEYWWSDAWLLQSIVYACHSGPASIDEIIIVGDALNHAIFTYAEIDTGLVRLTAGDWITEADGKIHFSKKYDELTGGFPKGMRTQREKNQELLGAKSFDPKNPKPPKTAKHYPGLTKKAFNNAVKQYKKKYSKK